MTLKKFSKAFVYDGGQEIQCQYVGDYPHVLTFRRENASRWIEEDMSQSGHVFFAKRWSARNAWRSIEEQLYLALKTPGTVINGQWTDGFTDHMEVPGR